MKWIVAGGYYESIKAIRLIKNVTFTMIYLDRIIKCPADTGNCKKSDVNHTSEVIFE